MRNDSKSTPSPSNNPSSSSSNSSSKPPTNAFRRAYLDRLVEREEATVAGTEAETRGPWKVLQLPPAGGGGRGGDRDDGGNARDPERWVVLRAWEEAAEAEPHGKASRRRSTEARGGRSGLGDSIPGPPWPSWASGPRAGFSRRNAADLCPPRRDRSTSTSSPAPGFALCRRPEVSRSP